MPKVKKIEAPSSGSPLMAMYAQGSEDTTTTRTRRNRAATIERSDKYTNIDNGSLPFSSSSYSSNQIDAREAITLCQKAYFNVSLVRNIVELMVDFSVGDVHFRGGNKLSRDFFSAWWNKINGYSFQDKFYREYYRSGNIFIYRFDGNISPGDVKKIISTFGLYTTQGLEEIEVEKLKLPARYVILNPADIMFSGGISFYTGSYYKRLSDYELQRLKKPQNDEDQEVLMALPAEVRKQIEQKTSSINLPLDLNQVTMIFYKKQDYEPFSAPMVYPVLEDINAKLELKRLDMAIARTQQQVILLVTTGTEPDKGGVNNANLVALQKLFQNESIGRVLVADYTTKAEFVIPKISDILTSSKYEELDRDINLGLSNILTNDEKFANQSTKVEVFLARLEHGRQVLLNDFLIPEIRRISKAIGFKSYPIPCYDTLQLKKNDVRDRVYVRLAELGLLTPEETFTALDSGRLPDESQILETQNSYKKNRDSGLYQPLIGGVKNQDEKGRPGGISTPQSTKKMTPIGGSEQFSLKKFVENMKAATSLGNEVAQLLKLKFKKKSLSEEQINIATEITKLIIANEEPDNWRNKIANYVKEPVDKNKERINLVQSLASEYQCDDYLASLLLISKKPYVE